MYIEFFFEQFSSSFFAASLECTPSSPWRTFLQQDMDVNTHPVRDPQTSPWTKHSSLHRHFHHRHSRRIKETLVLDILFFLLANTHEWKPLTSSDSVVPHRPKFLEFPSSHLHLPPTPPLVFRQHLTSNRVVCGVSLKLYCDRSVSLLRNDQSGRPPVSLWHVSSSLVALTVNMYFHPKIFQRRQVLLLKNPRTGTPKPPPQTSPRQQRISNNHLSPFYILLFSSSPPKTNLPNPTSLFFFPRYVCFLQSRQRSLRELDWENSESRIKHWETLASEEELLSCLCRKMFSLLWAGKKKSKWERSESEPWKEEKGKEKPRRNQEKETPPGGP